MNFKTIVIFVFLTISFVSCNKSSIPDDNVVAEVYDESLYRSEVNDAIPSDISSEDSISFANDYIRKWIKNKLLLRMADMNLSDELNEIDRQVEDYKNSLMIYNYQQKLLREKLDTAVSEKELDDYYEKTAGNFKLDFNIVKAVYIKIPKRIKDQNKIKSWYWSNKEDQIKELENYCYENAEKYFFGEEWMSFDDFQELLPKRIEDQEQFLRYSKFMDTQDSLFNYYISIKDYKLKNDTTPLTFIKNKLSAIIINDRKMEFLKNIENSLFEKSKDDIRIFESKH